MMMTSLIISGTGGENSAGRVGHEVKLPSYVES